MVFRREQSARRRRLRPADPGRCSGRRGGWRAEGRQGKFEVVRIHVGFSLTINQVDEQAFILQYPGPEELAHHVPLHVRVLDARENDGKITGDPLRPQCRGPARVARQNLRGGAQGRVGVENPVRQPLEEVGLVRSDIEMMELNLRLRPRQSQRALERCVVAVLVREIDRFLPRRGHEGRERDARGRSRKEADTNAKAENRVEHRAGRVGERTPIDHRRSRSNSVAAPEEPPAVGLELLRAEDLTLDGGHVARPDSHLRRGAGAAAREKRSGVGVPLGLNEELREGRMRIVGGGSREHDLGMDVSSICRVREPMFVTETLRISASSSGETTTSSVVDIVPSRRRMSARYSE